MEEAISTDYSAFEGPSVAPNSSIPLLPHTSIPNRIQHADLIYTLDHSSLASLPDQTFDSSDPTPCTWTAADPAHPSFVGQNSLAGAVRNPHEREAQSPTHTMLQVGDSVTVSDDSSSENHTKTTAPEWWNGTSRHPPLHCRSLLTV